MNVRVTTGVLVLACLASAGCGTVANLAHCRPEEGGRIPFGGIKHDLACIQKAPGGDADKPETARDNYPRTALTLLCAVDLPFSFVGDVITWPYTASFTYVNQPAPFTPIQILPPLLPAAAPVEAPPVEAPPEMRPLPVQ